MKAQELRIGNFVTLDDKTREELWHEQIHAHNEFYKVDTIYGDGDVTLELDNENVEFDESDLVLIPLTKELMLRLGFKQLDKYTFVYKGWFIHYRVKEGSFIYNKRTKIEYVHQLQNLLFFLSGHELKLEI